LAKILEYKGKELLIKHGICVPHHYLAYNPTESFKYAKVIGGPVVLKAQVFSTGRMKSGAIKFARDPYEAEIIAREMFGMTVKGQTIDCLLVEKKIEVVKEYYLGITINYAYDACCPEMIVSSCGGIDIEKIAIDSPDSIAMERIKTSRGMFEFIARNLWRKAGVESDYLIPLGKLSLDLYNIFRNYEARSLEVNPIIISDDGELYCVDIKITIDDNAVFRHPELNIKVARELNKEPTDLEIMAWKVEEGDYRGTFYFAQVATEGNNLIGYHGIGGGGSILGVDLLSKTGLKVANFCDTSGNLPASKIYRCAKIILRQPNINGYVCFSPIIASQPLSNTARGIAKAFQEELKDKVGFPVVFAAFGNEEELARDILYKETSNLPIRLKLITREDFKNKSKSIIDDIKSHILADMEEKRGYSS
jgi:succinyl-CoA synthetase beta subunit